MICTARFNWQTKNNDSMKRPQVTGNKEHNYDATG